MKTNFRGELITNEPDILNRLIARAERAKSQRDELLGKLRFIIELTEARNDDALFNASRCLANIEQIANIAIANVEK